MKTNRFEEILRGKLESIQSDFQDQDWEKWQAFNKLHGSPSFWHSYRHWLGYAVAAVTTAVMVVQYVSHSNQNEALRKEMEELKQQMEVRANPLADSVRSDQAPRRAHVLSQAPDTVYIIERQTIYREVPRVEATGPEASAKPANIAPSAGYTLPQTDTQRPDLSSKAIEEERIELGELTAPPAQEFSNSRNYLYRRLQARMPRKTPGLPPAPSVALAEPRVPEKSVRGESRKEKAAEEQSAIPPSPPADQKTEDIKKEESLLPRLGLGLPYRVGVSQQWQGNTRAFSVVSEFLMGKHWAVQAGLSWRKLEAQKFFNEKMYLDKTREDIRKQHARKLPPSFEIFSIHAETTLLQIPLGLTYRGEMGNQFTYLLGMGTNLNIQARQRLTVDFRRPTKDHGQQIAERYLSMPTLNNVLFSAGIEKRWSPIVLQAGSFVESRAKTFPFLKDRTHVGFQAKILYELGGSKNN